MNALVLAIPLAAEAAGQWSTVPSPASSNDILTVDLRARQGVIRTMNAIHMSTDAGATWTTTRTAGPYEQFTASAPDAQGGCIVAGWSYESYDATTLYRSTDRGNSWTFPVSGLDFHWNNVFAFGDTVIVFGVRIAPHGSMIMRSTDGGVTWAKREVTYESIFFLNGEAGWATDGLKIFRTLDGGIHWVAQYSPDGGAGLHGLTIVNARLGWAYGSMGEILTTRDGGDNWQHVTTNVSGSYRCAYFLNQDTGWIAGSLCLIKTTDGGSTWVSQDLPVDHLWTASGVAFKDPSHGFLCTDGAVFRTSDGGDTWTIMEGVQAHDMRFVTNTLAFAAGPMDNIWRSTDGGETWQEQITHNHDLAELTALSFTDPDHGWVVGKYGTVYRTPDRGETWELKQSRRLPMMLSAAVVDQQHIWLAGAHGLIMKYDAVAGAFVHQPIHTSSTLITLCFVDAFHGWTVSSSTDTLFRTTDGGVHWLAVPYAWTGSRRSLHFVDALHGWLLTGYAMQVQHQTFTFTDIHRSSDAGASWERIAHLEGTYACVYFINNTEGLIVGEQGRIMRSTDGGIAWKAERSGTTVSLTDIAQSDHVFIGGSGGVLLRSDATYDIPDDPSRPDQFVLYQNFPNPFNPTTTIRYGLPARSFVRLTVSNALGQVVATLVDGEQNAGMQEIRFDGHGLASGAYFCRINAGTFTKTMQIMIIR